MKTRVATSLVALFCVAATSASAAASAPFALAQQSDKEARKADAKAKLEALRKAEEKQRQKARAEEEKRRAEAEAALQQMIAEARKRVPKFKSESFVEWMKGRGADKEAIGVFHEEWKEGPDARITDRVLRELDEGYANALELVEDGKPDGVLQLTKFLASAKDDVTRAHARYFLARAVLDEDDPEMAGELLGDFIIRDRGLTLLDGEAAFYYAYALSLIPRVDSAILNLEAFLKLYPDASERYRANAQQLLQELQAQWQSPLHALADEMKGSERKLRKERFGKPLQVQQLDIVEKLASMIEELEKQQQSSGGSPSGNGPSNGPASESSLPGGQGRVGKLHGSRGVKDRWGNMKDKDRAKILAELQTKLPERYRVLLEKYYKRVNEGGK